MEHHINGSVFLFHVNGVIHKANETNHQHVALGRLLNAKASFGRAGYTRGGSHPEHVGTGNGFALFVFYSSAYLCVCEISCHHEQHKIDVFHT